LPWRNIEVRKVKKASPRKTLSGIKPKLTIIVSKLLLKKQIRKTRTLIKIRPKVKKGGLVLGAASSYKGNILKARY